MHVIADRDRCIGSGQCVIAAGTAFAQDEELGLVQVLQAAPERSLHDAVRQAARLCPVSAIALDEGDETGR